MGFRGLKKRLGLLVVEWHYLLAGVHQVVSHTEGPDKGHRAALCSAGGLPISRLSVRDAFLNLAQASFVHSLQDDKTGGTQKGSVFCCKQGDLTQIIELKEHFFVG